MPYSKEFTDANGRTQSIRTVGGMVLVKGFWPTGEERGITFDAAEFRTASIDPEYGNLNLQVGNEEPRVSFGASRVAFTLEDVLEAVAAARSGS